MNTKSLLEFEKTIGFAFINKNLLEQSFIHRSYINEHPQLGKEHNERLEFLGDAVLELVVTQYLYKKYPGTPEGQLTAYRSALVRTESISEAALNLGVNDYMFLSKGEARDMGKAREYILANAFEAIVGSVYLDQGFERAEEFITNTLLHKIDVIVKKGLWRDAKSFVQEKAQEIFSVTPTYKVMSEIGPDHDKEFTIAIMFGDDIVTTGEGK